MAVVWLALLAELMMHGADIVACLLDIPDDVMGLTITAGGTSLPNLFASTIVAKQVRLLRESDYLEVNTLVGLPC